jgi:hypothetical protein
MELTQYGTLADDLSHQLEAQTKEVNPFSQFHPLSFSHSFRTLIFPIDLSSYLLKLTNGVRRQRKLESLWKKPDRDITRSVMR